MTVYILCVPLLTQAVQKCCFWCSIWCCFGDVNHFVEGRKCKLCPAISGTLSLFFSLPFSLSLPSISLPHCLPFLSISLSLHVSLSFVLSYATPYQKLCAMNINDGQIPFLWTKTDLDKESLCQVGGCFVTVMAPTTL